MAERKIERGINLIGSILGIIGAFVSVLIIWRECSVNPNTATAKGVDSAKITANPYDTATVANKIPLTFGQVAIENARQELNSGAKGYGNDANFGEFVKKYNSIANLPDGYPWAATFVSWCYNKDVNHFKSSASVKEIEEWFSAQKDTFTISAGEPQPGDIYFYSYEQDGVPGRAIGLVDSFVKSNVSMFGIEGNSNDDENGPDYKVARIFLSKDDISGWEIVFARVKEIK